MRPQKRLFDCWINMVTTFKHSLLQRLMITLFLSPVLFVSYYFIRDAFPIENYLYSFLCMVVAISFDLFAIHILNEFWVKVIIDKEGISVKKLYNSFFAKWKDIKEYGREQPFGYGGGNWRYYVIVERNGDKKLKVCHGRLKELKELKNLNAHIISKLETSKLKNICPGMID